MCRRATLSYCTLLDALVSSDPEARRNHPSNTCFARLHVLVCVMGSTCAADMWRTRAKTEGRRVTDEGSGRRRRQQVAVAPSGQRPRGRHSGATIVIIIII